MVLKIKVKLLLIIFTLIFFITACSTADEISNAGVAQEVSDGLDEHIVFKGIGDEEIYITVEEIKELRITSKEVTSVNSSGEKNTFEATGALLEDVLQKLGFSQKDLMGIRLVAGDGYSIEVPKEILEKRDIMLAYEIDGDSLDAQSRPLRVVIPEERAMYWVRNLEMIEALEGVEQSQVDKLLFMETLEKAMTLEDYIYYESTDKAIKALDLLKIIEKNNESETVYLKAVDGLEKNETLPIFKEGYIKVTGVDAPTFLSPDIPKGMYVKHILYFSYESTAWISFEKAQEKLEALTLDDKEGIRVEALLREVGGSEGDTYIFTAQDGYIVEVEGSDLTKGVLYKDQEGRINVYFQELPKSTSVKDLLSIELKK